MLGNAHQICSNDQKESTSDLIQFEGIFEDPVSMLLPQFNSLTLCRLPSRVVSHPGIPQARRKNSESLDLPLPLIPNNRQAIEALDEYKKAVFLFADIKEYTNMSQTIELKTLCEMLNTIYSEFTSLAITYGSNVDIRVVKTMGDCIMLSGASCDPIQTQNICAIMVYLGYLMSKFMFEFNRTQEPKIDFRFGINAGPAIKLRTQIPEGISMRESIDWIGEGVNKASRMESSSHPNQVQVTQAIYDLTKDYFEYSTPSNREVKSYGPVETCFLITPKERFYQDFKINSPRSPDPSEINGFESYPKRKDSLRRTNSSLE